MLPCLPLLVLWLVLRWLLLNTIQARQTAQDGPSGDVVVVDHQTTKLLISGGVEIVSTYQLTLTKGQGHYPPFPGLFVCLIKGAGALPACLLSHPGGAVFNWLWGPVRDQTVVLLLQMDRRSSGRSTTNLVTFCHVTRRRCD